MARAVALWKDELMIRAEHLPKFDLPSVPACTSPPSRRKRGEEAYRGDLQAFVDRKEYTPRYYVVGQAVLGMFDANEREVTPRAVKHWLKIQSGGFLEPFSKEATALAGKKRYDQDITPILRDLAQEKYLESDNDCSPWRFPSKWPPDEDDTTANGQ